MVGEDNSGFKSGRKQAVGTSSKDRQPFCSCHLVVSPKFLPAEASKITLDQFSVEGGRKEGRGGEVTARVFRPNNNYYLL